MKELAKTFVALIILVGVYLVWQMVVIPARDVDLRRLLVTSIDPATLRSVHVRNTHGSFRLVRGAEREWLLERGPDQHLKTDGPAVAAFLSPLRRLMADRELSPDSLTDDETGLDRAAATVFWEGQNDRSGELHIGAPNRLAGTAYVRSHDSSRVFLVPLPSIAGFLESPHALRKRDLFRLPVERVSSLKIVHDDRSELFFTRHEDGRVTLRTDEESFSAFPPSFTELCTALDSLRADGFTALSKPAAMGFDPPRIHVTAHLVEPEDVISFSVGSRSRSSSLLCYVLTSDSEDVALVPAEILAVLSLPHDEYRNRSAFSIAGEAPTWIRLETPNTLAGRGHELEIQRRGDSWNISLPPSRRGEDASSLVRKLDNAVVKQYRRFPDDDLTTYGVTEPQLRVLIAAHNDPERVFAVGTSATKRTWVLLPDHGLANISPHILESLMSVLRETGRPRRER